MATENRTALQVESDRLDMEMFRLAGEVEKFAMERPSQVNKAELLRVSDHLNGSRWLLRRYMHPKDQEATNG